MFVIGYLFAGHINNWYQEANTCVFTLNQSTYKEGVMLEQTDIRNLVFDLVFDQKFDIYKMDVKPFVKYGDIYVPIRYVFNAFNFAYQYNKKKLEIIINDVKINGKTDTIYIDQKQFKTNNPIIVRDNEIFVSLKDLNQIFGFNTTKKSNELFIE